jgi:beta-glucosidase/6-phospho-beta-glucosidase/beta-galactosidase
MGITADISSPHALTHTHEDHLAVQRAFQFYVGWFMHPIFSTHGNYPRVMIDRIGELSRQQGFSKSRLPTFTDDEIKMIHNTSDFFGINTYTSLLVTSNDDTKNPAGHPIPSFMHDMGTIETQDDNWEKSGSVWLRVHPSGIRHLLNWIRKEYNNPIVYVTENGVSDKGGMNDVKRVEYFNAYLTAILSAIKDGCNVKGYIAWSLMDSYEWVAGYTEKFGLYHVDFNSPNKTRTPKMSAKVFSKIAQTNRVDYSYRPEVPELPSAAAPKENNMNVPLIMLTVLCVMLVVIVCCIVMICVKRRSNTSSNTNLF